MKKTLVIVLTLVLTLTAFAGCSENGEELNIYSEASYDNESKFVPDEESKESATSESGVSGEEYVPLSGEFIVKDKKYTFEGNDLVLVSVENKTNKNYSVTITGTYLDKDGKAIKTETQTYDQYSAGFSNYFLFMPEMQFDSFTYEFKTQEAEGPFYAKDLGIKYDGLNMTPTVIMSEAEKGDFTRYPTVSVAITYQYPCNTKAVFWIRCLLMNEQGEIFFAFDITPGFEAKESFGEYYTSEKLWQTKDEDREVPEELKNFQLIPVIMASSTDTSTYYPKRLANTIIE